MRKPKDLFLVLLKLKNPISSSKNLELYNFIISPNLLLAT